MQGTEVRSGNPVLALSGEIDMASAEAVTASLRPLIESGGPVIVDLSKVTFMDSTGPHIIVEAAKARAHAAPIPPDAPVTTTPAPASPVSTEGT